MGKTGVILENVWHQVSTIGRGLWYRWSGTHVLPQKQGLWQRHTRCRPAIIVVWWFGFKWGYQSLNFLFTFRNKFYPWVNQSQNQPLQQQIPKRGTQIEKKSKSPRIHSGFLVLLKIHPMA